MTVPNANSYTCSSDGTGADTWTYAYSGTPSSADGGSTTITDPDGHYTCDSYAYGALVFEATVSSTGDCSTTTTTYLTKTSYVRDPALSLPVTTTNGNRNTITDQYDGLGDVTQHTDALGNTTSYSYNSYGEQLTKVDPAGETWTNGYDSNGNLTSQQTPVQAANSTETLYGYDTDGRLTCEVQPNEYAASKICASGSDITTYSYTTNTSSSVTVSYTVTKTDADGGSPRAFTRSTVSSTARSPRSKTPWGRRRAVRRRRRPARRASWRGRRTTSTTQPAR